MKKYFLLLVIVVLFIACSDESSDDSISDTVHKDVFSDTINPSDTAEIRDSVEIKDIQDAGPDAKDISDITDTDSSDSLTDTGSDTSVITDITGSDTAEDTVPGDTGDIVIIDISDIQGQDTGSDNIIYDAMTDTSGEDISDSGDTDAGLMQPVINELMILPNYSDTELGQYIEIYNPNSFGIDINGYRLKTDKNEFIISNSDCDTVINAGSYLVAGATKDSLKNSYAKVKCEWKDLFTLTNALYLELIRPDNLTVERIDLTTLTKKKGSSLERKGNKFELSPALITFLDDTGLYNGDRGSPAKTNYDLIQRGKLTDSNTQNDRIQKENSVHRYSADLAAGDIIAFYADVDRINGDLKLFASFLDSDANFITPDIFISGITYDFFIYHLIKETKRYYFQIQPDYFTKFNPANIEVTYFRANGIKVNKDLIELKVGEQYQIMTYATFSQNKDLKDFLIDRTLPDYSSNDPYIADVSKDGIITAKNIGSVTIYINYHYIDTTNLDTSMVVNVYNQPSNETCNTAIDATNGISTYASTIGAQDDYNPEKCVFSMFSGGDIVYYVDAEPNATYEVLVTPYGSFDPMIYVYDDCSKKECLYGTVLNGAGDPEKLTFKNETFSKKRYYIVIDGEAGDDGSFQLTITKK